METQDAIRKMMKEKISQLSDKEAKKILLSIKKIKSKKKKRK